MPNIRFTCLEISKVKDLSKTITLPLAEVIGCPNDWITFSADRMGDGYLFCEGEVVKDSVFAYVEWFDRGEHVKDAVAKIITDAVMDTKRDASETIETVTVVFTHIDKDNYYENGVHY